MAEEIENSTEPSPLQLQIIRQIEYYFGDYNLVKDKFLQEIVKQDNGWVPLDTLVLFNRLKVLTTDHKVITDALKKSKAQLLEVHEDGAKIRRSPEKALPENDQTRREEVNSRSVYVKGFPKDSKLDVLLEYFNQQGSVVNVQMRYYSKIFKGSVFAVFATVEEAEAFAKKENLKFKEDDVENLIIEAKSAYFARKVEEKEKAKANRKGKSSAKKEEESKDTDESPKFEKGLILEFTDVVVGTSIENVKSTFNQHSSVAFVDFSRGLVKGFVRFNTGNPAEQAVEKTKAANEGKVLINGSEAKTRVLEGDEETEYWKKYFEVMKEKCMQRKSKGGSRGGRGGGRGRRGGFKGNRGNRRGFGKGRNDDDDDDEDKPVAKKAKTEDSNEKSEPHASVGNGAEKQTVEATV